VRSLERLLAILEVVQAADSPATATLVAAETGLSVSTASRLMRELLEEGLLERARDDNAYVLGSRLLNLARGSSPAASLVEAASPYLYGLRDLTGETVSLHVRRGDSRVCIAGAESTHMVRRVVEIGVPIPLHRGAPGAILAADLSPREYDDYASRTHLSREDARLFKAFLAQARETDHVIDEERVIPGISGVAVPVLDRSGQVQAALAVSGPSSRWVRVEMERHLEEIRAVATAIGQFAAAGER
jgi:DNA-binding IclR family transcriptional regulator